MKYIVALFIQERTAFSLIQVKDEKFINPYKHILLFSSKNRQKFVEILNEYRIDNIYYAEPKENENKAFLKHIKENCSHSFSVVNQTSFGKKFLTKMMRNQKATTCESMRLMCKTKHAENFEYDPKSIVNDSLFPELMYFLNEIISIKYKPYSFEMFSEDGNWIGDVKPIEGLNIDRLIRKIIVASKGDVLLERSSSTSGTKQKLASSISKLKKYQNSENFILKNIEVSHLHNKTTEESIKKQIISIYGHRGFKMLTNQDVANQILDFYFHIGSEEASTILMKLIKSLDESLLIKTQEQLWFNINRLNQIAVLNFIKLEKITYYTRRYWACPHKLNKCINRVLQVW